MSRLVVAREICTGTCNKEEDSSQSTITTEQVEVTLRELYTKHQMWEEKLTVSFGLPLHLVKKKDTGIVASPSNKAITTFKAFKTSIKKTDLLGLLICYYIIHCI